VHVSKSTHVDGITTEIAAESESLSERERERERREKRELVNA